MASTPGSSWNLSMVQRFSIGSVRSRVSIMSMDKFSDEEENDMASLVHNQSPIGDHKHLGNDQQRTSDASQLTRPSLRSFQGRSTASRLSPKNGSPLAADAESCKGGDLVN